MKRKHSHYPSLLTDGGWSISLTENYGEDRYWRSYKRATGKGQIQRIIRSFGGWRLEQNGFVLTSGDLSHCLSFAETTQLDSDTLDD